MNWVVGVGEGGRFLKTLIRKSAFWLDIMDVLSASSRSLLDTGGYWVRDTCP